MAAVREPAGRNRAGRRTRHARVVRRLGGVVEGRAAAGRQGGSEHQAREHSPVDGPVDAQHVAGRGHDDHERGDARLEQLAEVRQDGRRRVCGRLGGHPGGGGYDVEVGTAGGGLVRSARTGNERPGAAMFRQYAAERAEGMGAKAAVKMRASE